MLATLPSTALAARAAHADGSLPPLALVLRRRGPVDGAEPVTATLETHPRFAVQAGVVGAERTATGWRVGKKGAAALLGTLGHKWRAPGRLVTVRSRATGLELRVGKVNEPSLAPLTARIGTPHPLSAVDAHATVEAARRANLPVFTLGPRAEFAGIDADAARTVVGTCAPGMPAVVDLSGPCDILKGGHLRLPAADLAAIKLAAGARLTLRADAADARAVSAAGPHCATGATGEALHPWQAKFVGKYLAAGRGLVNALAPGLGKSAAALGALRAVYLRDEALTALVLAPTTSRHQWLDEADRFFPEARVLDAGSGAALEQALRELADDNVPRIVLTTPDLLARHSSAAMWTDVVVDEATFLTQTDSTRARAAWAARQRSQRGMPLTGTPRPRRLRDLEPLVCFALDQPTLFASLSLADHDDADVTTRLGAYLHTHEAAVPAPTARHSAPRIVPSVIDAIVDAAVRDRLTSLERLRPERVAAALETEMRAARMGYADPAALLASKYALAADVRTLLAGRTADAGAKLAYAKRWVLARPGQQLLVASDFLSPLNALASALHAELGPDAVRVISSKVAPATRERSLAAFHEGTVRVLLLSGSAHLGLNLQPATGVLHLDVPATASALTQRAARSARLGSSAATVDSVVPVLDGSVEDRLADLIGLRGLRPADRTDPAGFALRLLATPSPLAA